MFEKDMKIGFLLDFYGEVLSERKRLVMDYYYNDDLSLGEIAEEIGISRQGVRDLIKKAGEELVFAYGEETGAKVLVYRFPNLFGKWCRPNYNSAVATFCNNIANDLPITVNDPAIELELLYIDDLVDEMLDALEGKEHKCNYDGLTPVICENGRYCVAPVTHKVTLGEIVDFSIAHGSFKPEQIDKMKSKTRMTPRFLEALK